MLYNHEALSGISGSVSLACWLFVLVPQLFENYISKSADGISLAFLIVWLVTFPVLLDSSQTTLGLVLRLQFAPPEKEQAYTDSVIVLGLLVILQICLEQPLRIWYPP